MAGQGRGAGEAGGRQGPPRRPLRGLDVRPEVPDRGRRSGQADPSEHRLRLRHRRRGRRALHRDGAFSRPDAPRGDARRAPDGARPGDRRDRPRARRPGVRPRRGGAAPGREARQHPGGRGRPGEGHRLRHRQGRLRRPRSDPDRFRARDRPVRVARAGAGRAARRSIGSLRRGRDPVRSADRQGAVPGRDRRRRRHAAPHREPHPAPGHPAVDPTAARSPRAAGDGQAPGRAIPFGRRDARRARAAASCS